jgi:hypothetical protein
VRLERRAQARGYMLGAAVAALAGVLALIRVNPGTKAAALPDPSPPKPVDYRGFFAPAASRNDPAPLAPAPHTRTRAS